MEVLACGASCFHGKAFVDGENLVTADLPALQEPSAPPHFVGEWAGAGGACSTLYYK